MFSQGQEVPRNILAVPDRGSWCRRCGRVHYVDQAGLIAPVDLVKETGWEIDIPGMNPPFPGSQEGQGILENQDPVGNLLQMQICPVSSALFSEPGAVRNPGRPGLRGQLAADSHPSHRQLDDVYVR